MPFQEVDITLLLIPVSDLLCCARKYGNLICLHMKNRFKGPNNDFIILHTADCIMIEILPRQSNQGKRKCLPSQRFFMPERPGSKNCHGSLATQCIYLSSVFGNLFAMVLPGGLLHTWLLIGIYGSVIAQDVTSDSDLDFSQFLPSEIDGSGTELALGLDPASTISNSLGSDLFAQTNPAGPGGETSASDIFSNTDPSGGLFIDDAPNMDLIAGSGVGCVSYEGQPISRIRRSDFCVDNSLPQNLPAAVQQPTEGSDATFPPIGSHPGRYSGRQNDPKPRVRSAPNEAFNTDEDFKLCPSGFNGYREYAVCDSGIEADRWRGVTDHDWRLWDVSHRRHISGFSLLRHGRLMIAGSDEPTF